MIGRLAICVVLASLAMIAIVLYVPEAASFVDYYQKHLRGNLFAGFLSLGGFLFSLKTFIVIKLKENVYDCDGYRKVFSDMKKINGDMKLYTPLENVSNFLFYAVLFSIIAAILQLTLGLLNNFWAVVVSIGSAIMAILVLLIALFMIKTSLNDYFKFINDEADC